MRRSCAFGLALLGALGSVSTAAPRAPGGAPRSFCVVVRRLHSGSGATYDDAVLWVRGGKIEALFHRDELAHPDRIRPWGGSGQVLSLPPEVPIYDRSSLVAVPGLVFAGEVVGSGARDAATASARFRALDAYDPYAPRRDLLAGGVTTVFLHPGRGRLVTGEGAVVKLGPPGALRVLRARAELCVEFGAGALGPPARVEIPVPSSSDVPIEPAERQRPSSRLSLADTLRERLRRALRYDEARRSAPADARPDLDLDLEALAEAALAGRLRIEARREDELREALAFARASGLRPVLAGATEVYRVLDEVAAAGFPVVYESPARLRGPASELAAAQERLRPRLDAAARLAARRVPFALTVAPGEGPELRLAAALAVRGGLSPERALRAVTSGAAEVLGVGDRVGTLAAGRDADFVLLSDAPLRTASAVVETWIDGRRVYRAPSSDALVVRAGTLLTCAGDPIPGGEVLIEGGSIAAVGSSVPHPPGARILDAGPRSVVTPGFVDAFGHLGYRNDRGSIAPSLPVHLAVADDDPERLRVALGGVTTVVAAPWKTSSRGGRLAAFKTAAWRPLSEDLRRGLVLRPACGVVYDFRRGDPLEVPPQLRAAVRKAKAYVARWKQYEKDLAKWRAARAKARESERAARAGRRIGPAPTKEPSPARDEGATPEKGPKPEAPGPKEELADPVSGVWRFTLSGGPLPEDQVGELVLKLEDDERTISGIARREGRPEELPVSGRIDGTSVTLILQAPSPFGPPKVEAELVEEDLLRGTVRLGPFTLQFEAVRTEREAPAVKLELRRRSKGGAPTPPPVDESLEPLRAVLEGRGALLLYVASPAAARTLADYLRAEGLRGALLDFSDADLVAGELRQGKVGLVLRPEASAARAGRRRALAAEAERLRLPVAFASHGAGAAAQLPLRALVAVEGGLSQAGALRALTIDAARLFGLDDRVGSLEAGKDGDLLVFDGPPFEATSRLRAVVVGGRVIEEEER